MRSSLFSSSQIPFLRCASFSQALRRVPARGVASKAEPAATYPAYVVRAPITEVSKTKSNGIRVASEVSKNLLASGVLVYKGDYRGISYKHLL